MQITGSSSSRLSELRKYTVTDIFTEQYPSGGNMNSDGVDYSNSLENEIIIYYIGGIKYTDLIIDDIISTSFIYIPTGIVDYTDYPIYKDPNKERIIENPKISNDVFIIRQELTAFEKNFRLQYVGNLIELETYASGKVFNIVNNT